MTVEATPARVVASRGRASRALWFGAGWVAVALGGLGIVVPGLPTTVFFIVAASCFARSSPRFERWVLDLPTIGPLVRDHRAGLGMPRRAKVIALAMMWAAIAVSGWALWSVPVALLIVVALGLVGTAVILWRVPTREAVLATRAAATPAG